MTTFSPTVCADVSAALTDDWAGHREIWKRMGCWAPGTVREALVRLAEAGRCEMRWVDHYSGKARQFRRIAEAS